MKAKLHRSQRSAGLRAELVHGAGIQPRKRNNGNGEDSSKNGWMEHTCPMDSKDKCVGFHCCGALQIHVAGST